jgi:hypothetical protein
MAAWEFNGRGLMYVPQSADWADEYHHHGYILYNQLLRLWALRCAAQLLSNDEYSAEAQRVQMAIEKYFSGNQFYAAQVERMWKGKEKPYWMMGFNTAQLYTQFDLQANALALLLAIGDDRQQQKTVQYTKQLLSNFLFAFFLPGYQRERQRNGRLENQLCISFSQPSLRISQWWFMERMERFYGLVYCAA